MRQAASIVALALLPLVAEAAVVQKARYLMGTVCEIAVDTAHEAEAEGAFAEAQRIERMLSTWSDDSELARLNRGEGPASPELLSVIAEATRWSAKTNGAFDPRVKTLIDLWRTREEGSLPDRTALNAVLARREESPLEEGGFGKGYALDRMMERLTAREAMIDFGGQIIVRGELRVTVADPADRLRPVLALTIRNESISTSSGSEKTFEAGGRRFSHIIDPRSGEALPPRGSVSVIAAEAMTADILSTAMYVMGEDDGLRWADANGVAALFINPQRQVRLSAKARERARELELLDETLSMKD